LTAEGRLTGWLLGILPFLVAIGILSLNPGYLRPLVETPTGQAMLWTALALQAAGFGIIWWLVHPRVH
jgi:tight adherence protein B